MSASVRVEAAPRSLGQTAGLVRRAGAMVLAGSRALGRGCLWVARRRHALRAALALLLVGGFLAGLAGAEAALRGMDAFHVDPSFMTIREKPPWLDEDWAATIPNPFEGRRHVNLFEPDLAGKVLDAYQASPWIEDVCFVGKEFPNRLKIRIRVRTPLAAVPFGTRYLLVDCRGVLLPRAFDAVPDFGFPLRVVEGVTVAPPAPGKPWDAEALRAGLQVTALLTAAEKKVFDRIRRVDVSLVRPDGHAGRTEILLFAAEGGGPIEWGSAPGRRESLEIPVEKKLENLENLLTECADLRTVKYALVQFDQPWYRPAE